MNTHNTCLLTGGIATVAVARQPLLPILLQAPKGPKAPASDVHSDNVVERLLNWASHIARGVV
jgi:hypothetical protein